MKKMRSMLTMLLITCLLVGIFASTAAAATVTIVRLTIDEPVVGGTPSFKATLPETASTEVVSVSWDGTDSDNPDFHQGKDYSVSIKVKIKDGKDAKFGSLTNIKATVNGKEAVAANLTSGVLTVKYTWKALGGAAAETPEDKLKAQLTTLANAYIATNGTTKDDLMAYLKASLPGAEIWTTGGTYVFTRKMASETKDGSVSMAIGITYNGVTVENHTFKAIIPALNTSADAMNIAADKALMEAAFSNFIPTAQTTGDQLLAAVNAAAQHGTKAAWGSNYKFVAPTMTTTGSITSDIILTLGDQKLILTTKYKQLPIDGNEEDAKIDEDKALVSKAVANYAANNSTTEETLLAVAKAAAKHGTAITCTGSSKTEATYEDSGKIVLNLILKLGNTTRDIRTSVTIPKLVRNYPKDKISINLNEWIVLERTNIERYKQGKPLLTINGDMQEICNIREKEVEQKYSHTRPDGRSCFTAFEEHSKEFGALTNAGRGENIAENKKGTWNGDSVSTAWVNSPGHYKNMIEQGWVYIGIGVTDKAGVQMFSGYGSEIETIESSTGSFTFASEDEMMCSYLICTMKDGAVSYLPLCPQSMRKDGNHYYASIAKFNKGEFKLTIDPSHTNRVGNFTDVTLTDYFAEPVKWAVSKNVTTGTAADKFSPGNTCTRAQILTFLWRAVGSPKATAANPFTDIKTTDYFYDAAIWASQKGMVTGSTFAPNTPCTRADTVVYLWKNAGSPTTAVSNTFTDVSASSSYAQAVAWAVQKGVTSGTSATTFSPATTCTRGQIVTFLYRALK